MYACNLHTQNIIIHVTAQQTYCINLPRSERKNIQMKDAHSRGQPTNDATMKCNNTTYNLQSCQGIAIQTFYVDLASCLESQSIAGENL